MTRIRRGFFIRAIIEITGDVKGHKGAHPQQHRPGNRIEDVEIIMGVAAALKLVQLTIDGPISPARPVFFIPEESRKAGNAIYPSMFPVFPSYI
ncbi:MAG: hypothetical protein M1608_09080 [Candidatus Omnitrophica bacterium]|nr:hypothetical protein [Candidatus Omnitrophota bacterium]